MFAWAEDDFACLQLGGLFLPGLQILDGLRIGRALLLPASLLSWLYHVVPSCHMLLALPGLMTWKVYYGTPGQRGVGRNKHCGFRAVAVCCTGDINASAARLDVGGQVYPGSSVKKTAPGRLSVGQFRW
jgi:hypothetical protein